MVDDHSFYKREGDNIYSEIYIPYSIAVLGGYITVPTLYGPEKLKVPSKTSEGTILRLKRKGVSRKTEYGINHGDMHYFVHNHSPFSLFSCDFFIVFTCFFLEITTLAGLTTKFSSVKPFDDTSIIDCSFLSSISIE